METVAAGGVASVELVPSGLHRSWALPVRMLEVRPAQHQPVLLSIPDAAVHLGVTERYVRRLVYERRVPFYKVGRLVRFRETELDQWLEASRVEPSIGARR